MINPVPSSGANLTLGARDHQFRVASKCELLPYLISLPLRLSRKQAKNLLRFRAVKVRRKAKVQHDTQLESGDVVIIAARKQVRDAGFVRHGLRIVHLDDAVVVVDKPTGLLSMGSEREKERTAHRILNEHLKMLTKSRQQQAFIVHRLDRETSGLMLFARNPSAQAALQQDWKNVTKRYLAIVEGLTANLQGTLKDRLAETTSFVVHRADQAGELAITHYRVLRRAEKKSLLELHARNRTQAPDPRSVGGRRPPDHRRSEIWRERRSRAKAGAPRLRAEISPSGLRRINGVSQRSAPTAQGVHRTCFSSKQLNRAEPVGSAPVDFPAASYSPVTPTDTVPSALEGLTAVFGMGTGVTPPL